MGAQRVPVAKPALQKVPLSEACSVIKDSQPSCMIFVSYGFTLCEYQLEMLFV